MKVGYKNANNAITQFGRMKRKFNEVQSDASLNSLPLKAFATPRAIKTPKSVTKPAKDNKPKPLASKIRDREDTDEEYGVKRNSKRAKVEEMKVDSGAGLETDNSFADIDDFESE